MAHCISVSTIYNIEKNNTFYTSEENQITYYITHTYAHNRYTYIDNDNNKHNNSPLEMSK